MSMNVYLLLQETEQPEFQNKFAVPAYPSSVVLGVYKDRARAENEKLHLETEDENKRKLGNQNIDSTYYLIDERPVLE